MSFARLLSPPPPAPLKLRRWIRYNVVVSSVAVAHSHDNSTKSLYNRKLTVLHRRLRRQWRSLDGYHASCDLFQHTCPIPDIKAHHGVSLC